jgi:SNF2 family DNA or RNA helicase
VHQVEARRSRADDLAVAVERHIRARDWLAAVEPAARAAALAPGDRFIVSLYVQAAEGSRNVRHRIAALEHLARIVPPTAVLLGSLAELHRAVRNRERAAQLVADARRLLPARGASRQLWVGRLDEVERWAQAAGEGEAQDQQHALPLAPRAATNGAAPSPAPTPDTPPATAPATLDIPVTVASDVLGLDVLAGVPVSSPEDTTLARLAMALADAESFDRLLAAEHAQGLLRLSHQEETARKVLAVLLGRALLADEVGLGKTIEAGLILSEYLLRGRVARALVLVPPSLVGQWREELASKFGISSRSTEDEAHRRDPIGLWDGAGVLVASLATARAPRHRDAVVGRPWDLVIVDEAHTLKNHRTESYALVERLQTRFLLLLTATPVENRVEELFNLVNLIRPGHLGGRAAFVHRFGKGGGSRAEAARAELRVLLGEVMVRNTRVLSGVSLPPRFARTLLVEPAPDEQALYAGLAAALRLPEATGRVRPLLSLLLEEAGSSPLAVRQTLARLAGAEDIPEAIRAALTNAADLAGRASGSAKARALLQALSGSDGATIVFTRFRATLVFLAEVLGRAGVRHERLDGNVPPAERAVTVERWRATGGVLLSTDVGSEGLNLQSCHRLVNFDLPWNPMRIEQRIGRLHRIGQEHPVEVLNLCQADSVEERILQVLDERINLFELVVGEIETILGYLDDGREFPAIVLDAFAERSEPDRTRAFGRLGDALAAARQRYRAVKAFDEALFRSELGV